ncbi:hypothetical protein AAVH_16671 [Aphelenchoides avenae]|nr:hypothetical protein AAVH_16671 [Aphelenchus avenae]
MSFNRYQWPLLQPSTALSSAMNMQFQTVVLVFGLLLLSAGTYADAASDAARATCLTAATAARQTAYAAAEAARVTCLNAANGAPSKCDTDANDAKQSADQVYGVARSNCK